MDFKLHLRVGLPLLAILLMAFSANIHSATINIKVGAGIRPPFLTDDDNGMGPDIISVLNLIQDDFLFELVSIPISRRVQSLEEGWVDIIMWDNINWGWDVDKISVSRPLLQSKDIFISHAAPDKDQSYFSDFTNKQICIVNGYHYEFLNFETEYEKLEKRFSITLVRTEEESILMAINRRCDISAVSESAIRWFLTVFPKHKDNVILSERFDTQYTRHILVPKYSPISTTDLDAMIEKAHQLGLIKPIYEKYGQQFPILPTSD